MSRRTAIPDFVGVAETPELVRHVDIWLDHDRVRNVIRADQAAGWIEVVSTDERGRLMREGDEIRTEIRTGVVQVTRRSKPV